MAIDPDVADGPSRLDAALSKTVVTATGATVVPVPSGARMALVWLISGGGGGGSGAVAPAAVGGAGGGAANVSFRMFPVSMLGASVTVTVGAGGSGGLAQTNDNSTGNAGSAGGDTTFGTLLKATGSEDRCPELAPRR